MCQSPSVNEDKIAIENTIPVVPNLIKPKTKADLENQNLNAGNPFPKLEKYTPVQNTTNNDTNNLNGSGESNSLPVAAINVDMIDGQPMYTIQIMGQYIPLAAITIPTSEGPLELQSATATLPSQIQCSEDTTASIHNMTLTNAGKESVVTSTCAILSDTLSKSSLFSTCLIWVL